MDVKSLFMVLFLFMSIISVVVILGDEFSSTGVMDAEDVAIHSKLKSNYEINFDGEITKSNTKLEDMRNKLQQENKENSFSFEFSQALVWAYDLLSLINNVTNITTTVAYLIGFTSTIVLSVLSFIDLLINFSIGFAVWRMVFK